MPSSAFAADDAIAIAPAADGDLPLVAELAQRVWPVAYAGILTPQQIANMLEKIYCPDNLRAEMASGHRFWLAYRDGAPVAYASGYRESADIIWIKKIYVDPAAQGRGIGARLMETVIAAFRPARELRLLANPHNIPAHDWYRRQGFTKIAEVPVRMGDWHFDDFMFAKPLP